MTILHMKGWRIAPQCHQAWNNIHTLVMINMRLGQSRSPTRTSHNPATISTHKNTPALKKHALHITTALFTFFKTLNRCMATLTLCRHQRLPTQEDGSQFRVCFKISAVGQPSTISKSRKSWSPLANNFYHFIVMVYSQTCIKWPLKGRFQKWPLCTGSPPLSHITRGKFTHEYISQYLHWPDEE